MLGFLLASLYKATPKCVPEKKEKTKNQSGTYFVEVEPFRWRPVPFSMGPMMPCPHTHTHTHTRACPRACTSFFTWVWLKIQPPGIGPHMFFPCVQFPIGQAIFGVTLLLTHRHFVPSCSDHQRSPPRAASKATRRCPPPVA